MRGCVQNNDSHYFRINTPKKARGGYKINITYNNATKTTGVNRGEKHSKRTTTCKKVSYNQLSSRWIHAIIYSSQAP